MLIGEYRHSLDAKKRVALPAKFRKVMGEKVIITYGLDSCLFLYPEEEWAVVAEKLAQMPMLSADSRRFNRFMLAGAVETEIDSMGRILIPDFLKEYAGLGSKVVFAGVHKRAELWDEEKWKVYTKQVSAQADTLAEKLSEVGIF